MEKTKILSIDVQTLIQESIGSFGDIYCKFAIIQNRLDESSQLSKKERQKLVEDYKIFRDEVARRVESCRQMIYKHYKYDQWHQEIKRFYEMLPCGIGSICYNTPPS